MLPATRLAVLLIFVASAAFAQGEYKPQSGPPVQPPQKSPPTAPPVSRPRVTAQVVIGDSAPDFSLESLQGGYVRLSRLRAGWVTLLFASRHDRLATLDSIATSLQPLGVKVVVVFGEKVQTLAKQTRDHPPSFTALADPTGDIAALYGLWDNERDEMRPGFVLMSPGGNVRMALFGQELPAPDVTRLVQYAVTGL